MTRCRACTSERLKLFLSLGDHPPANAFVSEDRLRCPEVTFPLDGYVCLRCGLIQVGNVIPADFFREYVYVPSASETMHDHFSRLATFIQETLATSPEQLVVDIGANDGLFLTKLADRGVRAVGIEPAHNLTAIARSRGVEVVNEYFTSEVAADVRRRFGPAHVIVTTNTFNHIDDLHAFMRGVLTLLADEGTFVVEVPQAIHLVQQNEFDTVYHEHLSEFSVMSLVRLFDAFEMRIVDIVPLPVHGGSMRVFARRRGEDSDDSPAVADSLREETRAGLFDAATYDAFGARVAAIRQGLLAMLDRLRGEGRRIAGYGAPAKGNTLLNYYGIGPDRLLYLADRNPIKHGLYSPGMHIPVVPVERVQEDPPDYLLILAWNFADEIVAQQAEFHRRGGRFIVPIPEPRILG
jgi:SAM-dependent methyltransferase